MPETMTHADNFWLCMDEPTNPMVITAFMEFEGPVDFKRLQATIDSRLASFPRFRKRVVRSRTGMGRPFWESDPHYDLRSHVQRLALPSPGDKADLQEFIGNLAATPLDPARPLWQVHLIENYGRGCVLFFRIHHCIADGIALIHVLLSAADTEADAPWPKPESEKSHSVRRESFPTLSAMAASIQGTIETSRKIGSLIRREVKRTASDPAHMKKLAEAGGQLPADAASVLAKYTVMKADPNTPFKGRLGVRKQYVWTDPMALSDIKTVGRAIRAATLNDVLISTVAGAMRRYLKARNVAVNELDLRATVPVNIRKPGTETELGNKFSLVFLPLPVYLEDPVLRLKEVKRRMDRLKRAPDAVVNFGLLTGIGCLPPDVAKRTARVFGDKASCVLTNVPGPRQPLYFAGRKISNFMFWVPRSGRIGLGISILSYDGRVTLGVASDEKLMPDPQVLLEGFEKEFHFLLERVRSGKIEEEPLVLHDRYQESNSADSKRGSVAEAPRESPAAPGRCQSLTRRGRPCRNRARPGEKTCRVHAGSVPEADSQLQDVVQLMRELTA